VIDAVIIKMAFQALFEAINRTVTATVRAELVEA